MRVHSQEPFTLFCGLDAALSTMHREMRFLVRTLARLRHRHHAAKVFSSARLFGLTPSSDSFRIPMADEVTKKALRIFVPPPPPPRKAVPTDIESVPGTPVEEAPAEKPPTPKSLTLAPQKRTSLGSQPKNTADKLYVSVAVDERMPATFDVPLRFVQHMVTSTEDAASGANDGVGQAAGPKPLQLKLPKTKVCHFFDFVQWTRTGRILQYSHNSVPYAIEKQRAQLEEALRLAALLKCEGYQRQAAQEMSSLPNGAVNSNQLK